MTYLNPAIAVVAKIKEDFEWWMPRYGYHWTSEDWLDMSNVNELSEGRFEEVVECMESTIENAVLRTSESVHVQDDVTRDVVDTCLDRAERTRGYSNIANVSQEVVLRELAWLGLDAIDIVQSNPWPEEEVDWVGSEIDRLAEAARRHIIDIIRDRVRDRVAA